MPLKKKTFLFFKKESTSVSYKVEDGKPFIFLKFSSFVAEIVNSQILDPSS